MLDPATCDFRFCWPSHREEPAACALLMIPSLAQSSGHARSAPRLSLAEPADSVLYAIVADGMLDAK